MQAIEVSHRIKKFGSLTQSMILISQLARGNLWFLGPNYTGKTTTLVLLLPEFSL